MGPSRFAALSKRHALAVLTVLAMLIGLTILTRPTPHVDPAAEKAGNGTSGAQKNDDLILYEKIVDRMAAGESYYPVAVQELRAGDYPSKPFLTFRLPTLAYVMSIVGKPIAKVLIWLLLVTVVIAWWRRLSAPEIKPTIRRVTVALIATTASIAVAQDFLFLHEVWAGLLITLSIALFRNDRWAPAIIAAGLALSIRELALPYVLLLGAFALWQRKWKPFLGLAGLTLAFAAGLAAHAWHVDQVMSEIDRASPGWMTFGGWQSFLLFMRETSGLRLFPDLFGSIFVLLAIFGWISWRSATGLLSSLFLAGYAVIFMVLGRDNTFYWGLMVAPTLIIGLAFLPRALTDIGLALQQSTLLDREAA